MLLFIAFGIMIAYRSEELRNFYAGSISNMSYNDLRIIQIFRGFLWILFTLPILILLKGKRIEKIISISLMLAILPTILLLFPNPYMPSGVRLTHFVEVFISNGLFGLILGYVLSSLPPSKDENRPPHTSSLRKKSSRKAGGQAGHEGKTLEMTDTPDEIIEHHSCFCPECC